MTCEADRSPNWPFRFIILGGVWGSGKTTVAARLASRLGWSLVEGDDLHPASNKSKMASGQPLDDDRLPWLQSIRAKMMALNENGLHGVFTCSALKRAYRHLLQGKASNIDPCLTEDSNAAFRVVVVLLTASKDILKQRMTHRRGHFMPVSLLPSQLEMMEHPDADEADVIQLDTEKFSIDEVIDQLSDIASERKVEMRDM